MAFIPLLGAKKPPRKKPSSGPPPADDPPADESPADDPSSQESPEAESPDAAAGRDASSGLRASQRPLLDGLWGPHDSSIDPPEDPWDPVFKAHRWLRHRADTSEALWQESQARRDEIWALARARIVESVRRRPQQTPPPDPHPMAFVHSLRRCETVAEREAVMAWLEALFVNEPSAFNEWLAQVVHATSVHEDREAEAWRRPGDRDLMYEVLLGELRVQDARWFVPQPLPSVRFAAMLNYQLQEQPLVLVTPLGAKWRFWEQFVTHWRACFDRWMLHQRPTRPVGRLLLVPGESRSEAGHMADENAEESSFKRAMGAVEPIREHLAACPPDTVLVVLVSGGQVRSYQPESEWMANALRDPQTWKGPVPDRLVVMEDGLSRHTSNNLRAAAQLALRFGLKEFWIQTGVGHASTSLQPGWWSRYRRETTWGLQVEARNRLAFIAPMMIPTCGDHTAPTLGRMRAQDLRSLVFLPAIGDALNP